MSQGASEGTLRKTWAPAGGCGSVSVFMKFEVWERWISIIGGTETALPCVQRHSLTTDSKRLNFVDIALDRVIV